MLIALGPAPDGTQSSPHWWALPVPDDVATASDPTAAAPDSLSTPLDTAAEHELHRLVTALPQQLGVAPSTVRWVLSSVSGPVGRWLAAGITVDKCWDLSLAQRILSRASTTPASGVSYSPTVDLTEFLIPASERPEPPRRTTVPDQQAFFDAPAPATPAVPDVHQVVQELLAQQRAIATARHPTRLRLLVAAESQGALVAEEMHQAGLPWRREIHEQLLADRLGPRPPEGQRPAKLQALAEQVATALGITRVNPDSQQDLLRALRIAGVAVDSTNQWELKAWVDQGGPREDDRQALIDPVLQYRALARLWTANGWHWLDEWVHEDRFHARYVVGGVVTGRWAAHGGGAMQIPATVRTAVVADPDHLLTVADASQVEPRILAAMSRDEDLARAGSSPDLYREVAEQGRTSGTALTERSRAKVALLGAMYGGTTGDSAVLIPHLRRLYPRALDLLERAARDGETGQQVSTWLGRWSPVPEQSWRDTVQDRTTEAAESRATTLRRSAGRFTRNYVVQGTAAEWALCWMGEVRRRLRAQSLTSTMVFFVHDEIVLHGPADEAAAVEQILREGATAAGRLLFGNAPVDFPLTVCAVTSYADAH